MSTCGGSRLPSGRPPSPVPPGQLSRFGPLRNSRGGQQDRWQLLPAEPSIQRTRCSTGAWEKGQGAPRFCQVVKGGGLTLRINCSPLQSTGSILLALCGEVSSPG